MFGVFCNNCFRLRAEQPQLAFFISNCGHILCKNCLSSQCRLCHRPFRALSIAENNLIPKAYLGNLMESIVGLQKGIKFQCKQETLLYNYYVNRMPAEQKCVLKKKRSYEQIIARISANSAKEQKRMQKLQEYLAYCNHEEQGRENIVEIQDDDPRDNIYNNHGKKHSSNCVYRPTLSTPSISLNDSQDSRTTLSHRTNYDNNGAANCSRFTIDD